MVESDNGHALFIDLSEVISGIICDIERNTDETANIAFEFLFT